MKIEPLKPLCKEIAPSPDDAVTNVIREEQEASRNTYSLLKDEDSYL